MTASDAGERVNDPPASRPASATEQARAVRLRWVLLAIAAIGGALIAEVIAERAASAVFSYLGGLVLVVAALEFGVVNIRIAGRISASLAMPVALLSYLTTVIAFGLVLAASSPTVVNRFAIASGLFVGLAIWVPTEFMRSGVRSGQA